MNLFTSSDLVAVLPLVVLFAIGLIPLMLKAFRGNRESRPMFSLVYSLIGLILAFGLTAVLFGAKTTAFSDMVIIDGITVWSSCLTYVLAAIGLMLAYDHVATSGRQFTEYCFLLLSSTIGMSILIMSNDLIVTFIGIEFMSLCLYILIAMGKEEVLSKEAAFKYFVLGSFASAIFLYGVALLFGTAGGTSFTVLAEQAPKLLTTNRVFLAGFAMVILGFAFKVSIFPLHAWTPDVYQGASTPLTAFMSTAVKAASFVAFLRFLDVEGISQSTHLLTVLSWLAVLTIIVGNTAAIVQTNFKRVLAYSGVAHSGYAMIGLIAAAFGDNFGDAAASLLFYLFSYAFMTIGAFAVVGLLEKNENVSLGVDGLKGLGKKYPVLSLSLTILMMSLAGIPPMLGFFSKFYIFAAAVEQDLYWLAFWGILGSVISVYYYLRPVVVMYFSGDDDIEIMRSHALTRLTVVASALFIVVVGVLSSPVIRAVKRTVINLF